MLWYTGHTAWRGWGEGLRLCGIIDHWRPHRRWDSVSVLFGSLYLAIEPDSTIDFNLFVGLYLSQSVFDFVPLAGSNILIAFLLVTTYINTSFHTLPFRYNIVDPEKGKITVQKTTA